MASRRLVFADALRAFAIFLVVWSHLPLVVPHVDDDSLGAWGVSCFFVLSGFLLAGPYLKALLDPARQWPSPRRFLLRRFLRIYPLYALSVVVSCELVALAGKPYPSPLDFAAHLLMLQGLSPAIIYSINAPLWTMPVDAAFYVALPALAYVLACGLRGRSVRTRVTAIAGALAGITALGLLWRYVACRFIPGALTDSAVRVEIVQDALGMAPAFAIGIALAFVPLVRRRIRDLRLSVIASLVVAAAATMALRRLPFNDASGTAITSHVVFRDVVAAISVGAVIFALERGPRFLSAVALSRGVAWIASLAYAVYLFHYPILQVVLHLFRRYNGPLVSTDESLMTIALTLAVAWLAHRFVEQPFLDVKDGVHDPVVDALPLKPTVQQTTTAHG